MIHKVRKFFEGIELDKRPLLLGLSGGPDSIALFELIAKEFELPIHVAHVDHGWRDSSSREAEELSQMVKSRKIPFHLHRIKPSSVKSNLEDRCRRERYTWFKKLYDELDAQALLLAHHADDQSETVLKRIFEGAGLDKLKGIEGVSSLFSMRVLRPFLDVRKKQILDWLHEQEISYLIDETNKDPKYLRARMRVSMLPHLEKEFGKNISKNLSLLAKRHSRLSDYFERRLASIYRAIETSTNRVTLDLTPFLPLDPVELELIIKKFAQIGGMPLSYQQIETLADLILMNKGGKGVKNRDNAIIYSRGTLVMRELETSLL